jgi:hypothetical protein
MGRLKVFMSELFRRLARNLKNTILFIYLPRFVDSLTLIATLKATKKLKDANVERILIDSTVLAHAVTHETAWVDTGKTHWGEMEIDTGYAARIPVHSDRDHSDAARSTRYLPGIASLARRGHLTLATSCELLDEQWSQPTGRFRGYGLFDFSLFSNVKFETIKDPEYSVVYGAHAGLPKPSVREQRLERLEAKSDPLFQELLSVLGPNNSQDAWHIATAEHNLCYCFLTMDFRLIRNVRAQANNKTIKSLKTLILTPEEFGRRFTIIPIQPRLFSYHNASFPVVHQENWPDSKRHRPKQN